MRSKNRPTLDIKLVRDCLRDYFNTEASRREVAIKYKIGVPRLSNWISNYKHVHGFRERVGDFNSAVPITHKPQAVAPTQTFLKGAVATKNPPTKQEEMLPNYFIKEAASKAIREEFDRRIKEENHKQAYIKFVTNLAVDDASKLPTIKRMKAEIASLLKCGAVSPSVVLGFDSCNSNVLMVLSPKNKAAVNILAEHGYHGEMSVYKNICIYLSDIEPRHFHA